MLQRFLMCLCFTGVYAWTTPQLKKAYFKEQAGLKLFTYPALWGTCLVTGRNYIASLQKIIHPPRIARLQTGKGTLHEPRGDSHSFH